MGYRKMTRRERLAAENFGYSLANYAGHLYVENQRFTMLMPEAVDPIDRACDENWTTEQTAKSLDVSREDIPAMLKHFRDARDIVDSPNPYEALRRADGQRLGAGAHARWSSHPHLPDRL